MDIKTYMKINGLTQEEFATKIGCSQPAVSLYLSKERFPAKHIARRIVKATKGKVSWADLYAGERVEA